jgi:hypothetical protein
VNWYLEIVASARSLAVDGKLSRMMKERVREINLMGLLHGCVAAVDYEFCAGYE